MNVNQPSRFMATFSVLALSTVQAGGSAPTPLYHMYQQSWNLSPAMLTFVFAIYSLSVLAALLTLGTLSDYVGRRPVIACALLSSAAAMVCLAHSRSGEALLWSRCLQGIGTGAAATSLGAAMLDSMGQRGSLVNTATAFGGNALGTLLSSVLLAFAPAPTHTVYLVLAVSLVVQAVMAVWMPETSARIPGALYSLRPNVEIPLQARQAFARVSPMNVAGWALGGFYLSLMPSILRASTTITSPLLSGIVVASLSATGTIAIVVCGRWSADKLLPLGVMTLASGVTVTLAGVYFHLLLPLALGSLIAGVGFGASFSGAARAVLPLAQPHQRAGLLSAFYIESYLAFSVPAIAVGLAIPRFGLITCTYVYGLFVILFAMTSMVAATFSARRMASQSIASRRSTSSMDKHKTLPGNCGQKI
jgi:hypothetical protein